MTSRTVDASPPNTDVAAVHCTIHCRLPDDRAYTVVVKDLHTQPMTHSALGTMEAPGTKAKAGLNREILATNWSQLEQRLDYQVGHLAKVDPAYTPQTCAACGHVHRDNRPSQAVFACGACGHRTHADHNAAVNILARWPPPACTARGTRASARRGAFPSGPPTTREQQCVRSVSCQLLRMAVHCQRVGSPAPIASGANCFGNIQHSVPAAGGFPGQYQRIGNRDRCTSYLVRLRRSPYN